MLTTNVSPGMHRELRALLAEGSLPEFAYINARVVGAGDC